MYKIFFKKKLHLSC